MKRILLMFLPILFGFTTLTAQLKIEKSLPFDEPDYGWNKLLQLKNGNTFFFHVAGRDGIEVTVYNKQRKQVSSVDLESNLWNVRKMGRTNIVGLYEIKGEPVLFVVQAEEREPTLFLMRLNPNTGRKIRETKLGHLPKVKGYAGYGVVFGHVDIPEIVVEKDPNSDCYAVVFFDGFAHDRNERIRVVHYDGDHKVINTAFYESPDGKYKYLRYIGCAVDGRKQVFVTTYGYNGRAEKDTEPSVIVSKMVEGEDKFRHSLVNVSNDFRDTKSITLYNKGINKLQLLTVTPIKSWDVVWNNIKLAFLSKYKAKYLTMLNYIDPDSLSIVSAIPVTGDKIDEYGKKNIEQDYEYEGIPLGMVINKDNTTTILLQAVTYKTESYYDGKTVHMRELTHLGPVGISEFSDKGEELEGYAIYTRQIVAGSMPVLYMAGRGKGLYSHSFALRGDDAFLSYDYIYTDKARYVIFNDLPRNAEKDEDEKKRKAVLTGSKTNTMCYKLENPKMSEFYLFGEPEDKKESTYCFIESSNYNKDIGSYATVILERNRRHKEAKIAWITPE